MFKSKKRKKKTIPKSERIIKLIFILSIVFISIYILYFPFKDTISSLVTSLESINGGVHYLDEDFDISHLEKNNQINGEIVLNFYNKVSNLEFFENSSFDYIKFNENTSELKEQLVFSGNELAVFINNLLGHVEQSVVEKFIEIDIEPIENSSKFLLYSTCKLNLENIKSLLNLGDVKNIYLSTTSMCEILGNGLAVYSSTIQLNELEGEKLNASIEFLGGILDGENGENWGIATSIIRENIKIIKNKLKCCVYRENFTIVFTN